MQTTLVKDEERRQLVKQKCDLDLQIEKTNELIKKTKAALFDKKELQQTLKETRQKMQIDIGEKKQELQLHTSALQEIQKKDWDNEVQGHKVITG